MPIILALAAVLTLVSSRDVAGALPFEIPTLRMPDGQELALTP